MMPSKKTLLMTTSRFPYPLEKGDKLRAYHQIRELSKTYDIILCSLTRTVIKQEWEDELKKYCKSIHIFKLNYLLVLLNTFKMLFTSKPFQIGYFYQKPIQKKINTIISTSKPDLIFCQLIRTAEYVKNIHSIPKTLDYMDALSSGLLRRAENAKPIAKFILKLEGNRVKIYENKIFDYFNHHTIISKQDKKLIQHPNQKDITIIPNGIDDYFYNYSNPSLKKEYDLVFVGNLSYPPNIESCTYIVTEILPLFKAKDIELKVLLSGVNPSQKIQKFNDLDNVTISGWVDDIRESYLKGKIFIAPLFIGTGLQNKLLEAMALKTPCITTSLANNALGGRSNSELLIADTLVEFEAAINLLLTNSTKAKEITEKAQSFVKVNFDWETSVNQIPF
jgi:sugar transferase (PEP-CTERM/EpsH1 system associated)